MSWSLRFAEPIVLPDGGKLTTLREAVAHLGKAIPESDHEMPPVLTAAELLTLAAEHGGPIEFGVFNSDRKDTHWGRHKLKRNL